MKHIKYTLIADGSSDSTLIKVIDWTLNSLYPDFSYESQFADFRRLPSPPKTLEDKIIRASILFPSDILFIHRDAESTTQKGFENRINEVKSILKEEEKDKTICIVPIKMMESWLLFDKEAMKKAAGNRNYKAEINLPNPKELENVAQPKEMLHQLLKDVSGLTGRRLDKFNPNQVVHQLADYIEDFSILKELSSYQVFEKDLIRVMSLA